jgi:2-methylcitrate dehydratase PrpD
VRAPFAALANGALAHAFELDCAYHPSVGAHSGAGATSPALPVAQSRGKSGKDLITAFVAASEVMYRIGEAAHDSIEKLGFHAPGLLGVFGGAVAAARLMDLDAERMTHALGIGGSLCSGLLEFSKSGGGMVKRLHLGRAAESGVMAASLAREGFTGPGTVLEGKFGFLNVYCRNADATRFTAGLGEEWRTLTASLKRYACHNTAHVPVTAALELKSRHGIAGEDIESIVVASSEKMVSHHDIPEPQDLMMAQYSAPFCVALAFYRDPTDPRVFSEQSLGDPSIRALSRRVKLEVLKGNQSGNQKASRVTVARKDGRQFVVEMEDHPGMPQRPLTRDELRRKFDTLTASLPAASAARIFNQFETLETIANVGDMQVD